MGSLEPLKLTGYTDEEFTKLFPGPPYLMMLNPESVKWQRSIEYNQQQAPDSSSASQRYKSTPSDKLSFDVVIDCTGIVDPTRTNMAKEITTLESIIFTYNGTIHRPNFVKVQWGKDLIFNGVLSSFDISYTLFRPDGSPLRAKISLSFIQYIAPQTVKIQDKKESPDVSHLVTVVEGTTLPLLCDRIWQQEDYYLQAARYNDLNKFRNLKGIEKLIFPPIIPVK